MSFGNPMADIRNMIRKDLMVAEKLKPYAKHFLKDLAEIPEQDLEKMNAGPVDPSKALSIQKPE